MWLINSYKTSLKIISFGIFLLLQSNQVFSQKTNPSNINTAIKNTDLHYLNETLNILNVDTLLDSNGTTPLMAAIEAENASVLHFLLKLNANPNLTYNELTPLMKATYCHKIKILRLLLKYGASLNARNKKGFTAYDYAVSSENKYTTRFLEHYFERHLPNYLDGPYVRYKSKNEIEVQYLKYDSLSRKYSKLTSVYNIKTTNYKFKGFIEDTATIEIPYHFQKPPSIYKNVEKLVVIGDIHGQCDSLKKMLINNKITDQNLSWTFGNGHILFLGDIFDRGNQVTEALWLIYKLEKEAEKQGGKVHLLLGNHELMALEGDEQYLSKKYHYLYRYFVTGNKRNYSSKTLLGQWLRSKNTIEIINNILFVHGGINPKIIQYKVSVDSINGLISQYLTSKQLQKNPSNLLAFLTGENGPFWYRGMINNNGELNETIINSITQYFNITKIMVGHTYLPRIKTFFNSKVYGLDVPFYLYTGVPMQALYISNKQLKIINTSGTFDEIQ